MTVIRVEEDNKKLGLAEVVLWCSALDFLVTLGTTIAATVRSRGLGLGFRLDFIR